MTPLTIAAYDPCSHADWRYETEGHITRLGMTLLGKYCAACGLPAEGSHTYSSERSMAGCPRGWTQVSGVTP